MTIQQFVINFENNRAFKVGVYDLLGVTVDAIVNPANSGLSHGGGIAAIISDEGGPKIDRHCEMYIEKCGRIPVTKAVVTVFPNAVDAANTPVSCLRRASVAPCCSGLSSLVNLAFIRSQHGG